MNTTSKCNSCPMRAKYDEKPKSFAGRFWRFHIRFCPGWKSYIKSLDPFEYGKIKEQYHL